MPPPLLLWSLMLFYRGSSCLGKNFMLQYSGVEKMYCWKGQKNGKNRAVAYPEFLHCGAY